MVHSIILFSIIAVKYLPSIIALLQFTVNSIHDSFFLFLPAGIPRKYHDVYRSNRIYYTDGLFSAKSQKNKNGIKKMRSFML